MCALYITIYQQIFINFSCIYICIIRICNETFFPVRFLVVLSFLLLALLEDVKTTSKNVDDLKCVEAHFLSGAETRVSCSNFKFLHPSFKRNRIYNKSARLKQIYLDYRCVKLIKSRPISAITEFENLN